MGFASGLGFRIQLGLGLCLRVSAGFCLGIQLGLKFGFGLGFSRQFLLRLCLGAGLGVFLGLQAGFVRTQLLYLGLGFASGFGFRIQLGLQRLFGLGFLLQLLCQLRLVLAHKNCGGQRGVAFGLNAQQGEMLVQQIFTQGLECRICLRSSMCNHPGKQHVCVCQACGGASQKWQGRQTPKPQPVSFAMVCVGLCTVLQTIHG